MRIFPVAVVMYIKAYGIRLERKIFFMMKKNKLKLNYPAIVGNGYEDKTNASLPSTLIEATQQMKSSKIAKELFGSAFVDHFTQTREWEWRQHLKAVTDWEY